jgi:uncharacterized protein (DUF2267 family)
MSRLERRAINRYAAPERRTPKRTMNFERYAADGNKFINEVANTLRVSRNMAGRITRAVLHAVRDRLPPVDAVQFGQSLPMAIKGIYFDQYDLYKVPVVIRHPDDFLKYVYIKDGRAASDDFPSPEYVEDALSGIFRVLERTLDCDQVNHIRRMINKEVAALLY